MSAAPNENSDKTGDIASLQFQPRDIRTTNRHFFKDQLQLGKELRFIEYTFRHLRSRIQHEASGSVQDNINLATLDRLRFPLPTLPVQRRIAEILGSLDDKIELNRRMNETLEAMARRLFRSWFVDFDPVHAKAALRRQHPKWTNAELSRRALPNLSPEIAELFPDGFEDSTLGAIPTGWRAVKVGDVVDVGRGSSPRPIHDFMGGTIPWLKIADATAAGGPFIQSTKEFVTQAGSHKSVAVCPWDLILSNSATCGVPIFVDLNGCIHDGWLHFSGYRHSIGKTYLFHFFQMMSERLVHLADGSVQKNLNTDLIRAQQILVPSAAVAIRFEENCRSVFDLILATMHQSREISHIRDKLLPRLLSGELAVLKEHAR